jgi:phosphate starvation-inducible PhoH-like protein
LRGAYGSPLVVSHVESRSEQRAFLVTLSDGWQFRVGQLHQFSVQSHNDRARGRHTWNRKTPDELIDVLNIAGARSTYLPQPPPVRFPAWIETRLDAYGLGLLLGDGCFRGGTPSFSKPEPELFSALAQAFPDNELTLVRNGAGGVSLPGRGAGNPLTDALRDLQLWDTPAWEQEVPLRYRWSDLEVRLAMLQGLMDSDGWVQRDAGGTSGACFVSTSQHLAKNVAELAWSLGGTASVTSRPRPRHQGGLGRPAWVVRLRLPEPLEPFRLTRKCEAWRAGRAKNPHPPVRRIARVEPLRERYESVVLHVRSYTADHALLDGYVAC